MGSFSNLPLTTGNPGGLSPQNLMPDLSVGNSLSSGLLQSLLSGGISALANQPTNTSSNFSNSGTTSSTGTSSTARTLTPYQQQLQGPLFGLVNNLLQNPQQYTAPYQTAARDQVNGNYSGLADSLRQQFLSTGGGSSGKYGTAMTAGNLQRVGNLSNVDTTFAQTNAELPLTAESLGQNLLNMNFGQTSNTNQTGTASSSGTQQTKTSQGNSLLSGLGGLAGGLLMSFI